jgi:small subunit ribosomal protein S17
MTKNDFKDISTKHSVRGKLIEGKIIKMKSKKTAHIEITRTKFIPKYERYLVKKSKFAVHVPEDIVVAVNDFVLCGETKKISKTKSMIIIKKIDEISTNKEIPIPADGDLDETN